MEGREGRKEGWWSLLVSDRTDTFSLPPFFFHFKDRFGALRLLVFLTFEDPTSSKLAWWVSLTLILAILINCAAFITGSLGRYE